MKYPGSDTISVLFLGTDPDPFSGICFEAVCSRAAYRITAGIYDVVRQSPIRVIHGTIQQNGITGILSLMIRFATNRIGLVMRKIGVRVGGPPTMRALIQDHSFPVLICNRINSVLMIEKIHSIAPDLIVVAGFRRILSPEIIQIPRLGCVNVHPSLLPRYRGPNPCYWVLKNGEVETGVSLHFIDEGIDTGDIIRQETIPINSGDTSKSLRIKTAQCGARLLKWMFAVLESGGTLPRCAQDDSQSTYFSFDGKSVPHSLRKFAKTEGQAGRSE